MASLRTAGKMPPPKAHIMKNPSPSLLLLLLLPAALPLRAESVPEAAAEIGQPLNLTLPRDLTRRPVVSFDRESAGGMDAASGQARRPPQGEAPGHPGRIPYGSGYEARRQAREPGAASPAPRGGGSGAAAGGGAGRGGMGRGR